MKKLIVSLLILSVVVLAQTEIKSDTTAVEDTLKTNEDYKVDKDKDTWMETWREIEPSIRDFLSEEDDEEIEWKDDEGVIRTKKKKKGYFRAAAGGWDIFNIPIELTELNNQVSAMGLDQFEANMNYFGGGGWVFLGDNWRIGGVGADGNMTTSKTVGDIRKEVKFEMDFGGFLMERVWHPFNRTELYLSAVVGASSLKLEVYKQQGQKDWDDAWDSFNNNNTEEDFYNYKTTFKNRYFSAMPSIGFRYNIFRIFGVGGKVGYYYGIANEDNWKINGDDIGGVPKMDLSNIFYSVNFYFGA